MDDKRMADIKKDGERKAVTIGIYPLKHKVLYDTFYDENGELKEGKKPASEIPKMCVEHLVGGGNMDVAGIIQILLRIESKLSLLKNVDVSDDSDDVKDELDNDIDDFLGMTGFLEGDKESNT